MRHERGKDSNSVSGSVDCDGWPDDGLVEATSPSWRFRLPPTVCIATLGVAAFWSVVKTAEFGSRGLSWGVLLGFAVGVGAILWLHKWRDP